MVERGTLFHRFFFSFFSPLSTPIHVFFFCVFFACSPYVLLHLGAQPLVPLHPLTVLFFRPPLLSRVLSFRFPFLVLHLSSPHFTNCEDAWAFFLSCFFPPPPITLVDPLIFDFRPPQLPFFFSSCPSGGFYNNTVQTFPLRGVSFLPFWWTILVFSIPPADLDACGCLPFFPLFSRLVIRECPGPPTHQFSPRSWPSF